MVEEISYGIRIAVTPTYRGSYRNEDNTLNAFSYSITIENTSENTVQVLSRFWLIKDSLHPIEIVEGEGVVGDTPILHPGSSYTYQSNVILNSSVGAMKGYYTLRNLDNDRFIKAKIPCFQLTSTFKKN